ncbi:TRAP transporter large permease subunit [Paraburkholderia sp. MPAMCS5]|uniref:TRAP transporter large permease n=1 Tax=Paraburkholderia sp. MPAMCS5 TaxID=3112563 RepID=UPI002E191624|nr:TRAP transporter large permease subunit [Paraburkholderia sp. MPAMCS5]
MKDEALPAITGVSNSGLLAALQSVLTMLVEVPAALLVVAEVGILFAGVVSRAVLSNPLVWSDELASILFIWLAMLGSVIAFQRGEHMRMTALVGHMTERRRAFLDVLAIAAPLLFLVLFTPCAYSFAEDQAMITTPALEIADSWRAAALPVGSALMALSALLRLARVGNWRLVATALVSVMAIAGALALARPLLMTLGNFNLLFFFVGLVALMVLTGVPIAFSFALATFGYLTLSTSTPVLIMVGRMDEGMSHLILLAVPLFVFLGLLMEMTGMARAMVTFLGNLLGHVRGGLQFVLIGAMYLVSGISGSKAADMAAIAPVLFPEMKARGAKPGDLVALLSATGAQTETIPPSLVLITIGSVTGVSISALFTGGLLPGMILGLALCALVRWRYRKDDSVDVERASGAAIAKAFLIALPALALPVVIRIAVIEGIATATEVSTIGIVYSVVIGIVIYRRFDLKRLYPMLIETASLTGAILLIIGAATAMAWALTQSGFSTLLASTMQAVPGGRAGFMAISIVAFVILGSVLEGIPAIVLFGPLLFPIAQSVGINEVHYAMVVVLSMGVGLFTPPFGVGYYAACVISKVHPDEGTRPIIGYVVALVMGLIVVAAVPWLSTGFLPAR